MITTAVQQSSQIVEIQGAPATVQAAGGDFRATFAANVSAPSTQKGAQSHKDQGSNLAAAPLGSSLVKQAIAKDLSVESASDSTNQSLLQITDASKDEDAPQQAIQTASSSSLKTGSEVALNAAATGAAISSNDLRSAVLTPAGDETSGLAAAFPPASGATVASTTVPKQEGLSESVEGATVKGRKTEVSDSRKGLSFARAETIDPGISAVSGNDQSQLIASVPIVLAATPPSNPVTKSSVEGPSPSVAITTATPNTSAGEKSAQTIHGAAQLAGEIGAATAKTLTTASAASSAESDRATSPQLKLKDTNRAAGLDATATNVATLTSAPASVVASLKKAVPYSGPAVQTVPTAQTSSSSSTSSEQDPSVKIQDSEPAEGSKLTSPGVSLTDGVHAPGQAGVNPTLQVDVAQPALPGAPVRGGSSKAQAAAATDGKAKTSTDGAGDTAAATPATILGNTPIAVKSPAAPAESVAGRLIAAADTVLPAGVATPHTVGASAHSTTSEAASTVAGRLQGAVNAGSAVTEAASSSVQVGDAHGTLLATPTTLEVGVQSGTQGWLRIRAEVGDQGAVNASLAAGTSGARELLHSQIPALNAFLHSEQMAVTTTVVDRGSLASGSGVATGSGGLGSGDGSGSNGSLLQGGGAQNDGARQDSSPRPVGLSASDTVRRYDAHSVAGALDGVVGSSSGRASTSGSGESGRWLNVRV